MVPGNGPSFPSGHVMAAMALWGMLPLVVSLYTRRRDVWWGSVAVAATIIGGIAASRVYLGVHWFSDVVGGVMAGSLFLLGVQALYDHQHRAHGCGLCDADEPDGSTRRDEAGRRRRPGRGRPWTERRPRRVRGRRPAGRGALTPGCPAGAGRPGTRTRRRARAAIRSAGAGEVAEAQAGRVAVGHQVDLDVGGHGLELAPEPVAPRHPVRLDRRPQRAAAGATNRGCDSGPTSTT